MNIVVERMQELGERIDEYYSAPRPGFELALCNCTPMPEGFKITFRNHVCGKTLTMACLVPWLEIELARARNPLIDFFDRVVEAIERETKLALAEAA